jgi:hypothetical protein
MAEDTRQLASAGRKTNPGPFLAKVISHHDKNYMGILEVQPYREVGNDDAAEGQLLQARYLSPFYGVTSVDYVSDAEDTYNNTQKSYGMWMIPPDVGSTVMIMFVEGQGWFWLGCVLDDKMNFMTPGYASTYYNVDESKVTDKERVPVAEYNKVIGAETLDSTTITKPATPQEVVLNDQGLLEDDIRGLTTSSARRETPSMVFGISTPGPLDKQDGAKTGAVGKREYRNQNTFVSRLGGSSFVMDDGDDKWLRKTTASEGPPDYARVENQEDDGDPTLLHNELIRLRTRTGHQILMHNTEDLIYIGNARGTAWIELTSDGKIDIYAEDSISVHTKQDMNFYADRDINMECGRNFNTKVAGEKHTNVLMDDILIVDGNQTIKIAKDVNKTYEQNYNHTVTQSVNKVYNDTFLHHVVGQVDWTFDASLNWNTGVDGGGDVNASFGGNVTTKITGTINETIVGSVVKTIQGSFDLNTTGHNNLTAGGATNIKSSGDHIETAANIHMNGPTAATAATASAPGNPDAAIEADLPQVLQTHSLPDEAGNELTQSIMRRIPTFEPWPHHENLDPLKFKPDQTDRDIDGRNEGNSSSIADPAEWWKQYTTVEDTFIRLASPADPEDNNTGE